MQTLALEIVPGSEPIEGSLRAPDGSKRVFTGTLGLLAAVEALREPQARRAAGTSLPAKDFGAST